MGLFRRDRSSHATRRRARTAAAPSDPDFPFLSVDDAARLRSLTHAAFAELGVETQIHATHLEAADGHVFGLRNLFVACHDAGRGERIWRRAVRGHVARMVELRQRPGPADLPVEDLLRHAVVRVCSESLLPSLEAFTYRRRLGGDLVELLAYDGATAVAYLTDSEVERAGAGALRAAGVERLVTQPFGRLRQVPTPQSGHFTALVGDSVHTASRLLTLDDVLRRATGDVTTPHGVLVGVPNRHRLAFHRPVDGSLLGVVHGMLQFTVSGFDEGTGAISPHLYWRPPGGGPLEQLTQIDDETGLRVRIQGEFAEIVQRLMNARPPRP